VSIKRGLSCFLTAYVKALIPCSNKIFLHPSLGAISKSTSGGTGLLGFFPSG